MNIEKMTIEELVDLRNRIDSAIKRKVANHRKELVRQLSIIDGIDGGTKSGPKYRGPNGETWSGRGRRPEWLVAALRKRGTKLESFLI